MSLFPKFSVRQVRDSPRIVKVLLLQQFFEGFTPIAALYALMFERVGGLNFEQIGLLFAIWALAYLIAELPSGVLADYWSRRNVILLGGLLRAAGFAVWLLWPTFTGYVIGFALWGIMIACSSGAISAYLHEELKAVGKGKLFAKYFGWVMSALSLGLLAGYIVAAFLTLKHANLLIGLSLGASLGMSLVLCLVPEHPYKKQATYIKTLTAGFKEIMRSKKLRYVCYGLFSVYMIVGVLEELLPRLYAQFGLNDSAVSAVLAAGLLLTVVLLTKLESFVRFSLAKQMMVMCAGLLFLLVGLRVGGYGAAAMLLVFSLVFHLFRPVFIHHVQEVAEGNERATISSIPGLASGLLSAAAYAAIGLVASHTSEKVSIGLYGALWLAGLLLLAYWGRAYGGGSSKTGGQNAEDGRASQPATQF